MEEDGSLYVELNGVKVVLDARCVVCNGKGYTDSKGKHPCKACAGHGWFPTETGLQIIHFIDRWIDHFEKLREFPKDNPVERE